MAAHLNKVKLILDKEISEELGYDIYSISIQLKSKERDACHIPYDDIDTHVAQKILKKG